MRKPFAIGSKPMKATNATSGLASQEKTGQRRLIGPSDLVVRRARRRPDRERDEEAPGVAVGGGQLSEPVGTILASLSARFKRAGPDAHPGGAERLVESSADEDGRGMT